MGKVKQAVGISIPEDLQDAATKFLDENFSSVDDLEQVSELIVEVTLQDLPPIFKRGNHASLPGRV